MGRAPAVQKAMFDIEIESPSLEAKLEKLLELQEPKDEYRKLKKEIRQDVEREFAQAINVDGESGGWVRVGAYRFQAKAKERAAGEVRIGAGINFTLNVEAV